MQAGGEFTSQAHAGGEDRLRVHFLQLFGDIGGTRQAQGFSGEGGVAVGVRQHALTGVDDGLAIFRRAAGANRGHRLQNHAHGQALPGFPAIERVAVVRGEYGECVVAVVKAQFHRRGETPEQRGHDGLGHILKHKALAGLGERQHAGDTVGAGFAF